MPGDAAESHREIRRARIGIVLPFVLLGILVTVWTVGWFIAADKTTAVLDRALVIEAAAGRDWTCRERRTSGYPFRIEVSCQDVGFRGSTGLGSTAASLPQITAIAQVFRPRHVILNVVGPLAIATQSGFRAEIGWRLLQASVIAGTTSVERVSIVVDAPVVTGRNADPGIDLQSAAARLEAHMRKSPGAPISEHAYDAVVEIREATGLPLGVPGASDQPVTLQTHLRTTRLDALRGTSPEEAMEAWRLADGLIDVALARASVGDAEIRARGRIGLDSEKRPNGHIVIDASKAGTLANRMGLPQAVTRLPEVTIRMTGGRLMIGPVPVGRLAPLY
jgi:hypothetical protein